MEKPNFPAYGEVPQEFLELLCKQGKLGMLSRDLGGTCPGWLECVSSSGCPCSPTTELIDVRCNKSAKSITVLPFAGPQFFLCCGMTKDSTICAAINFMIAQMRSDDLCFHPYRCTSPFFHFKTEYTLSKITLFSGIIAVYLISCLFCPRRSCACKGLCCSQVLTWVIQNCNICFYPKVHIYSDFFLV